MSKKTTIFWFRRDLRLNDNAGLYHALSKGKNVLPIFIFDTEILDGLQDKKDKRVEFIHYALESINNQLIKLGSSLLVLKGNPSAVFKNILTTYNVGSVYTNHDYEPSAIARDHQIEELLKERLIPFYSFKDQVIFEKGEVVKDDGSPYTIYTPYSKKWLAKLNDFYLKSYPTDKYNSCFFQTQPFTLPSLEEIGFQKTNAVFPTTHVSESLIAKYDEQRNFPAIEGTSKLGIHLRFGTVSIRELARIAVATNKTWLNELIWREFFMMILYHYPRVVKTSFKPQYDRIVWQNNESEFTNWCEGKTGYPIVDAGMRELNETGFMHNRVRMIVASFLCKHLLIDWRWGEAYFAEKLLDYDLSANNGNWQWAAGTGCDSAPYFRIFNPAEQTKKFDTNLKYIKKWIPELEELNYPSPIVDHKFARERCLQAYKKVLADK